MSKDQSRKRKIKVERGLLESLNDVLEEYFTETDFDFDQNLADAHADLGIVLWKDKKKHE